jgi:CubicO group peptidase (beta-lactamase class C family)
MDAVKPEGVGFSSKRLGRINAVMQRAVDEGKCAGILTMVARRGQIAHLDCFGMMDVKAGKPMQPDTIFRIYSMSKPVTSVAVMMLYEEGHFQLATPVSEFIPGFKDAKVFVRETESGLELADMEQEITIHHLLAHTSGLSYGFHEDLAVDALYREVFPRSEEGTLEKMVEVLPTLPLAFQPGQGWRYSFSTDVLGYVVQVISGQPFDAFLQQRIFEPLGMVDTGFYVPAEKIDRFAALYGRSEEGELGLMETPATGRYAKPPVFLSGGGGLVSTVHDYVRFAQMLLNGGQLDGARLLGRKTVELMMMNHMSEALLPFTVNPGEPPAWGYGFGLGGKVMMDPAQAGILGSRGEYSWSGAASTGFWVDPQEEVIGLIMTQLMPFQPLVNALRVLVYQALAD